MIRTLRSISSITHACTAQMAYRLPSNFKLRCNTILSTNSSFCINKIRQFSSDDVEIYDLSKYLNNIKEITKQTMEEMKKVSPIKTDYLYGVYVNVEGSKSLLSDVAQIIIKTTTLAHILAYDDAHVHEIAHSLRLANTTFQIEVLDDKISLRIPKHQNSQETKHLITQIRNIHQNGANRIDGIRKRGQAYIDKVRGEQSWYKKQSGILKSTFDEATSSLTKLSRQLIKDLS